MNSTGLPSSSAVDGPARVSVDQAAPLDAGGRKRMFFSMPFSRAVSRTYSRDRGAVGDRLGLGPRLEVVAQGVHVAVGTDARIAEQVPGAADRLARFEDGVGLLGAVASAGDRPRRCPTGPRPRSRHQDAQRPKPILPLQFPGDGISVARTAIAHVAGADIPKPMVVAAGMRRSRAEGEVVGESRAASVEQYETNRSTGCDKIKSATVRRRSEIPPADQSRCVISATFRAALHCKQETLVARWTRPHLKRRVFVAWGTLCMGNAKKSV